jgi:NitT/TauT family transport system substrate-binding protein
MPFGRTLVAALALALAVPLAGAQSPEMTRVTIGVGGRALLYHLPLTIAERRGYFKAEGLDVEIRDFSGGARALQALVGGSVDLASGAYEHTIAQQPKGVAIEALVVQGKYAGIVLGVAKAKAAAIRSPAALKGARIGVTAPGSSTDMFARIALARHGLKPDEATYVGVGATAGAVAIMKRGDIDAISSLDPVISMLEADRTFVALVDTRTAKGMQDVFDGAYAAGVIYAPVGFAHRHPRTAQAVANAIVRALRFLQTSSLDAIVAAVPPEYHGDPALYKAALAKNLDGFRHDGVILPGAPQNVHRHLKAVDPSLAYATVDLDKTVNMQFARKAAATYP